MKILTAMLLLMIGSGGVEPSEILLTGGDFHRDFVVLPAGIEGLELQTSGEWTSVPRPVPEAGQMLLIAAHQATHRGIAKGAPFPAPLPRPFSPRPPARDEFATENYQLRVDVTPGRGGRGLLEVRWGAFGLRGQLPPGETVRFLDPTGCTGVAVQPRQGTGGAWSWDLLTVDACLPGHQPAIVQTVQVAEPYLLALVSGYGDAVQLAATSPSQSWSVP
jgi:hypothetical protein